MRRNGIDAQTLHSLIYRRVDDDPVTNKPRFERARRQDVGNFDLIVLDECSMIGTNMADDLLSFGIPVLAIGDPAQLPPVSDKDGLGYFTRGKPDVLLTEVHRQAADSPILKLATQARQGETLKYGNYGDSRVLFSGDIDPDELWEADQVIVGTNATRARLNRRARAHYNMADPIPMFGDKLICIRNNPSHGIFNGEMFTVIRCDQTSPSWLSLDVVRLEDPTKEVIAGIKVHASMFVGEPKPEEFTLSGSAQFDFGYAITAHKAQGSQWDNLVVIDESAVFRDDKDKWLYTAITRAAKTITVGKGRV